MAGMETRPSGCMPLVTTSPCRQRLTHLKPVRERRGRRGRLEAEPVSRGFGSLGIAIVLKPVPSDAAL